MKLELKHGADENGPYIELTEIYTGIAIKTDAGIFGICQRDQGLELHLDDGPWHSWQDKAGPVKLGPQSHVKLGIADLVVMASMACQHGVAESCDQTPARPCCNSCWSRRLAERLRGAAGELLYRDPVVKSHKEGYETGICAEKEEREQTFRSFQKAYQEAEEAGAHGRRLELCEKAGLNGPIYDGEGEDITSEVLRWVEPLVLATEKAVHVAHAPTDG
jgi:hypothetical protein